MSKRVLSKFILRCAVVAKTGVKRLGFPLRYVAGNAPKIKRSISIPADRSTDMALYPSCCSQDLVLQAKVRDRCRVTEANKAGTVRVSDRLPLADPHPALANTN